jgi:hypothetical protein
VVLKIWLISSKKIKLSTRKTFFSPKNPFFLSEKSNKNTDQDVNDNYQRHPDFHAPGPY